jgi:hypothetical protein
MMWRGRARVSDWYQKLRGHKADMGPGMPTFDYSHMPEVPPTFTPGDASAGLELVDTTLWIAKRIQENKPISPELYELFGMQAKRGLTDEVSLAGLDKRWRHLLYGHLLKDKEAEHQRTAEDLAAELMAAE